MFCEKCGAKIDDDSTFCDKCGAKIERVSKPIPNSVNNNRQPQMRANIPPNTYGAQNFASPPKPKKHFPVGGIISIVAAAVVIIGVAGFFIIGSNLCNPDKTADNYVKAVLSNDYNSAYDLLEVENSGLTSKANYTALKSKDKITGKVSDVKVDRLSVSESKIEGLHGDLKYVVSYKLSTKAARQQKYFSLSKQTAKKLLFFDTYKVNSDDIVMTKLQINAPISSKVAINGTALPENFAKNVNDGQPETVYTIPKIFKGNYTVNITAPYMDEVKGNITVNKDNTINATNFKFSKDIIATMKKNAEDVIPAYFQAAKDKKTYADVKPRITSTNPSDSNDGNFNNIVESIYYTNVTNIKYNGFTYMNAYSDFNEDTVTYKLKYKVSYDYCFTDFPESNYTDSFYISLTYVFENGEMKLQEVR